MEREILASCQKLLHPSSQHVLPPASSGQQWPALMKSSFRLTRASALVRRLSVGIHPRSRSPTYTQSMPSPPARPSLHIFTGSPPFCRAVRSLSFRSLPFSLSLRLYCFNNSLFSFLTSSTGMTYGVRRGCLIHASSP